MSARLQELHSCRNCLHYPHAEIEYGADSCAITAKKWIVLHCGLRLGFRMPHLLATITFAPLAAAPNARARPDPPAPTTTTVKPCNGDGRDSDKPLLVSVFCSSQTSSKSRLQPSGSQSGPALLSSASIAPMAADQSVL